MAEKFDFQAMLMSIESEQSIIGKNGFWRRWLSSSRLCSDSFNNCVAMVSIQSRDFRRTVYAFFIHDDMGGMGWRATR